MTKININIECNTLHDAEKIMARLCGGSHTTTTVGDVSETVVHTGKLANNPVQARAAENLAWNAQEVGRALRGEPSQNEWNADNDPAAAFGDLPAQTAPQMLSEAVAKMNASEPSVTELHLASDGKTLIPYDERIHTGGDNKVTKDGKWVKRRGVSDDVIKQVEAELSGGAPQVEATAQGSHSAEPTYDDLSGLIAKAFQPGSQPVNLMEIFRRNGVNNIMEVPRDNKELVAKIYADVDAAMQGGA